LPQPNAEPDDTGTRPLHDAVDVGNEDLRHFFNIWRLKKAQGNFPHPHSIDLLDFTDQAPRWSIIDVLNQGEGFFVRMCGTETAKVIGADLTGHRLSANVSELPGTAFQNRIAGMFHMVIDTGGPVIFGPLESSLEGREHMILHSICLPFSEDGKTVSRIIHALAVVNAS